MKPIPFSYNFKYEFADKNAIIDNKFKQNKNRIAEPNKIMKNPIKTFLNKIKIPIKKTVEPNKRKKNSSNIFIICVKNFEM
ncbi:hypothetical protein KO465_03695 [Candidatus Micrarchaeota archaeon]|nr:hypothetical protein [Candidatus Micrarchaeota archaeon]